MAGKEVTPKNVPKLGDKVEVHMGGEEAEPIMMEVEEVGEPKVVAQIGSVQLTETSYHLKPARLTKREPKAVTKK